MKSALISVLLSLGLGMGMFFLVLTLIPLGNGNGYAVLTVDASYPDRLIGDLLSSKAGGGMYISESTQWVFLDDFGVLQRIPLDAYRERVEIFDPRDDGYAEKLRSFFVRDGKRLFFIPLSEASIGTGSQNAEFESIPFSDPWINKKRVKHIEESIGVSLKDTVMGNIPFSIAFFGHEKPLVFYVLLFGLAVVVTLVLSDKPQVMVALLPVLGALALIGPAGFALSTALVAFSGFLVKPIRELLVFYRYQRYRQSFSGTGCLMKGLRFLTNLSSGWLQALWRVFLCLGVLGLCLIPGIQGTLPEKNLMILGVVGFLCTLCILGLMLWLESNQGKSQEHIRFVQVRIMTPANRGILNWNLIPFALVSLIALYVPQMVEGFYAYHNPERIAEPRYLIDPAEYEKHADFQASFSFMPLGVGEDRGRAYADQHELRYRRYVLGEDGLITDTGGKTPSSRDRYEAYEDTEIPPFPLENLIAFLKDFEHTFSDDSSRIAAINMLGLVPVLLVPGVYIVTLFGRKQNHGKKRNIFIFYDKRIAA
jgi:hypothetical protein